jgi:hypothetical protein
MTASWDCSNRTAGPRIRRCSRIEAGARWRKGDVEGIERTRGESLERHSGPGGQGLHDLPRIAVQIAVRLSGRLGTPGGRRAAGTARARRHRPTRLAGTGASRCCSDNGDRHQRSNSGRRTATRSGGHAARRAQCAGDDDGPAALGDALVDARERVDVRIAGVARHPRQPIRNGEPQRPLLAPSAGAAACPSRDRRRFSGSAHRKARSGDPRDAPLSGRAASRGARDSERDRGQRAGGRAGTGVAPGRPTSIASGGGGFTEGRSSGA